MKFMFKYMRYQLITTAILILLMLIPKFVNAQSFATGMMYGAALGANGSPADSSSSYAMAQHNIISCPAPATDSNDCVWDWNKYAQERYNPRSETIISVYQFAGSSGYKIVHRLGVAFHGGHKHILIEVSK